MANTALQFDGVQNYVTLGTLGNLGSNLGSGLYISFQIKTTSAINAFFGCATGNANEMVEIAFNVEHTFSSQVNHCLSLWFQANNTQILAGGVDAPTINFNDGMVHTVVFIANPTTNIITLTIDGVAQPILYRNQNTLAIFANFTQDFYLGCRNNVGSPNAFLQCAIDNFKIGTSAGALYGSYTFAEGQGTVITDDSGQGNNGTLIGTPVPSWITGLGSPSSYADHTSDIFNTPQDN